MVDHSTPEFAEQIVRLVHLAEAMNRKIDSLTDCVVDISRRLDSVEERLFTQDSTGPGIAEKIVEELGILEEERASHRLSANAVSPDELAALLGKR